MDYMQMLVNNLMKNNQLANNPIARNAFELYRKGDKNGLNKLAENLCRENRTTMEEVANSIMSRFPR